MLKNNYNYNYTALLFTFLACVWPSDFRLIVLELYVYRFRCIRLEVTHVKIVTEKGKGNGKGNGKGRSKGNSKGEGD